MEITEKLRELIELSSVYALWRDAGVRATFPGGEEVRERFLSRDLPRLLARVRDLGQDPALVAWLDARGIDTAALIGFATDAWKGLDAEGIAARWSDLEPALRRTLLLAKAEEKPSDADDMHPQEFRFAVLRKIPNLRDYDDKTVRTRLRASGAVAVTRGRYRIPAALFESAKATLHGRGLAPANGKRTGAERELNGNERARTGTRRRKS